MQSPVTDLIDNLIFTRTGSVWAGWRLEGVPYEFQPKDVKEDVLKAHTTLLRAHRGEFLLLGLIADTDPATVVEAAMDQVDLDRHPRWAASLEATLDQLTDLPLGKRTFWYFLELPTAMSSRILATAGAISAPLAGAIGAGTLAQPASVIEARRVEAAAVGRELPAVFEPRAMTAAENVWVLEHLQSRGSVIDYSLPDAGEASTWRSAGVLPDPILDECAQSDLGRRGRLKPWNVLRRRVLKVTDTATNIESYQVNLGISAVPSGGVQFPGGEWLGRLDALGVEADWAVRGVTRPRQVVTAKNARAQKNWHEQADQREGEVRAGAGGQVVAGAADLAEYQERLDADDLEMEVEATTVLTVSAPTFEQARDQGNVLRQQFDVMGFRANPQVAGQEALWWAGYPGRARSALVKQLAQITTATNFAMSMPVIDARLGDVRGAPLLLDIGGVRPRAWLMDFFAGSTTRDTGSAIGITGEMGCGKSVCAKTIAHHIIDMGGQVLALDRSTSGEWPRALTHIHDLVTVDVSEDARFSTDPIRLFGIREGGQIAQSFLSCLLNISATDKDGILLSRVLEAPYLAEHRLTCLSDVVNHLGDGCDLEGAGDLHDLIRVFASKPLARTIFDPSLPIMPLEASAIVFHTDKVPLPKEGELSIAHRFHQMSVEKRFGRAIFALFSTMLKHAAFRDHRPVGFFGDEAHALTGTPEGAEAMEEFVRDGRKHFALLILASQDSGAADFGTETLRGLIPCRILMRQRDRRLAEAAVRWFLGLPDGESVPTELVDIVAEDTSPIDPVANVVLEHRRGECLVRDFNGNFARARVMPPAQQDIWASVMTSLERAA